MFALLDAPSDAAPPAESDPRPAERDDAALLARASRRERPAFETLVRRHQAGLIRYLDGLLGNRADAEDAAQDALLAAFRQASTFRGASTVRSWLYAIAKNSARACLRSRGRRRRRELSTPPPRAVSDPSESWARELLSRLPEKFREVLLLCDVNGFTYEEAAETLRCPVKTVSSRLFRARERMAEFLRERDFG